MKRLTQILLIPFWLLGFTAAVVVVVAVAVWYATSSGFTAAQTLRHTPTVIPFNDASITSSGVS